MILLLMLFKNYIFFEMKLYIGLCKNVWCNGYGMNFEIIPYWI